MEMNDQLEERLGKYLDRLGKLEIEDITYIVKEHTTSELLEDQESHIREFISDHGPADISAELKALENELTEFENKNEEPNLFDLIQKQLHEGKITSKDVLEALGDQRPVSIVTRREIAMVVEQRLKPKYEPKAGDNPLAKLADITDAVIEELERNCSPDDMSWDGIYATIDGVMGEL